MNQWIFLIYFSLVGVAAANSQVAFLEIYDSHGKLVQYEPGSRFGHVALKVGNFWLQSSPYEGVQLITWEQLQKFGVVAEVLPLQKEFSQSEIALYLGLPFDHHYSWSDQAFYCSELLAKLLKIKPEPMQFNHQVWPESFWHLEGQPGMSPDKIYWKIKGTVIKVDERAFENSRP
ncbi:MAG: hypothetical protein ACAH59_00680 [Pseudobdellovibrionaceae bacterium]